MLKRCLAGFVNSLPGCATALSLSCLLLPLPVSAEGENVPLVADSNCGKSVDVQPMDAEDNPYAAKYEAWDHWVFEHAANPDSPPAGPPAEDSQLPCQETLRMYVTPAGFAVPLRMYYRGLYSPEGSLPTTNCPYFISAVGEMPPELRSGLVETVAQFRAAGMAAIPQWLADEVPLWALVLPGGEVVTLGALGSGAGLSPGLPGNPVDVGGAGYYSYDANGTLLGQALAGEEWWMLFFSSFAETLQAFGSSTVTWQELNGFIIFQDPANISIFEVYGFRGNKINDPSQVFQPTNRLAWIDGGNIQLVHEAQAASTAK